MLESIRDPIWQGIAAIITIAAIFYAIITKPKIREWLVRVINKPIFTHVLVLLIGIIIGAAIIIAFRANKGDVTLTNFTEIYRNYEWQWAGENWYGRLTFQKLNGKNVITQARVGLIEKLLRKAY